MNMKKILAFALCLVLVAGLSIGGTLAWITTKTDPVTNTFTYGDIDITLDETTGTEYKMIPKAEINKDPKVSVLADSEACWLFLKVEKTNNPDTYLDYTIDSGWTPLTGVDGVYYRSVDAKTAKAGKEYAVLTDNKVVVKENLTKQDLNAIGEKYPQLTFTAYAVQLMNGDAQFTPQAAWDQVKPTTGA